MGFVKSASASNDATATSIAVAFGSNVASGNLICVQACHGGITDQINTAGGSMADTRSTTYTERKFIAGQNVSGSVWSGVLASGGADTVTATLAVTQQFRRIAVHEVSGFATFESANGLRKAPQPADSGNITPAVNGCYLFGCMHDDQGGDFTIAAGTNVAWTLRENYQHANAPAATEDFIQATAATVNATFTEGGTTSNVVAFIMAFRPSAAADVDPPRFLPRRTVGPALRFRLGLGLAVPQDEVAFVVVESAPPLLPQKRQRGPLFRFHTGPLVQQDEIQFVTVESAPPLLPRKRNLGPLFRFRAGAPAQEPDATVASVILVAASGAYALVGNVDALTFNSNPPPLLTPLTLRGPFIRFGAPRGAPGRVGETAYLSAAAGVYVVTGAPEALLAARVLSLSAGVYSLSGLLAALNFASNPAPLLTPLKLKGPFVRFGPPRAVPLVPSFPGVSGALFAAGAGIYTIIGAPASLLVARIISAASGAYVLAGTTAALTIGRKLVLAPGTYLLTGDVDKLVLARQLSATGGAYTIAGVATVLTAPQFVVVRIELWGEYMAVRKIRVPLASLPPGATIYPEDQ